MIFIRKVGEWRITNAGLSRRNSAAFDIPQSELWADDLAAIVRAELPQEPPEVFAAALQLARHVHAMPHPRQRHLRRPRNYPQARACMNEQEKVSECK